MLAQKTLSGISEILFARKYAYDILRRFFIEEPSKEYLRVYVQRKMYAEFPFAENSKEIADGIAGISNYFETNNPINNVRDFEDLRWDYIKMMIGPCQLTAPPWESAYVRKERLRIRETIFKIRKKYRKYGFTTSKLYLEAEDHIGLELDFMYHLNNFSVELSGKEDKESLLEAKHMLCEQLSFLHNHLLVFAPQFANNVVKSADTQFYQGFAKVLKGFLLIDSKILTEILNREKFY